MDVTLTSLAAASALASTDLVYGVQGGSSRKITMAQIKDFLHTNGTYTPTVTGTTNVTSASGNPCRYVKIGNMVMLSGSVVIRPTSANTATAATVSLQIVGAAFSAGTDASGPLTGKAAGSPAYENGQIVATNGGTTLSINFYPANGGVDYTLRFSVLYPIP